MASLGVRPLLVLLALGLPLPASSARRSGGESWLYGAEDPEALTQTSSNESEKEGHPSNQLHAAATRSQTRACVRSRAELFIDAYKWLGLEEPPVPKAGRQVESTLEQLLLELFDVEDKIARHEQHLQGYWRPIGWIKRYRSHSRDALEKEKKALVAKLELRGFSYASAAGRCGGRDTLFSSAHSLTDAVYTCMRQKLHDSAAERSPEGGDAAAEQAAQTELMRRIVAEELLAHERRWSVYRALQKIQQDAAAALQKASYSYEPLMKECKKLVGNEVTNDEQSKRTLEELDVGYTDDNDTCQEVPGAMCPEGTAPDTRRRVDLARGAAAASTSFTITKSALAVGFGLAGFITGGPAGALAGLGLGIASPIAMPISAAVGFWYSLGPNTCACFLRECEFDAAKGVCALQHGNSADSTNPFGRALPYTGTKCGLKWKSNDTCELLDCTTMDYTWESSASVNGSGIFGKFGTYEGDASLYNCLSATGRAEAALSQLKTLPNGLSNTVEHRNVIFHAIGVPPLGDGPSQVPEQEDEEKPELGPPEEEGHEVLNDEEKTEVGPPEKDGEEEIKTPAASPTGGHAAAGDEGPKDPPGVDPEIGLMADPDDIVTKDPSGVDPDIGLMADPEDVDDDIGLMAD